MPWGFPSTTDKTKTRQVPWSKTNTINAMKPSPKNPFGDTSSPLSGGPLPNVGHATTPTTSGAYGSYGASPYATPSSTGSAQNYGIPDTQGFTNSAMGNIPVLGSVLAASSPSGIPSGSDTGQDLVGTGWATGLKPDMVNQLIADPQAFMRQILGKMGYNPDTNIGALQAALPYIQNMNQLALIMLGADPNYSTGDWNNAYNWMGNFASEGATPGGSYLDFSQGLGNLLNAASGGSSLNPLESYLSIADPAGQVDAFNSLAVPLAQATLNPLWARAMQDELQRQGAAWVSKSAGNNMTGAFQDFLRSRGFSGY